MAETTVLLTGCTGFIGGATLTQLVSDFPSVKVLLLVRGKSVAEARERVRKSVQRFCAEKNPDNLLKNGEIILGDLTDPHSIANGRLGEATHVLHAAAEKKLASERLNDITHVLHLASNTSFRSTRSVRLTNILGSLSLAHAMRKSANLQRFLHVGTAYICGDDSNRVVYEDDYPSQQARHVVEYTNSKAECEMLLEATAPELPLVVARPSVVVGHPRLGCLPSASIFWFYRTAELLRRLTCPLDTYDDVVPVDYVAESLLHLLFKPNLRYRRYHISAGASSSVTWREISAAFSECYGHRPENPYQIVDFETIARERDRMRELLGPGDEEHMLMALRIYYRFMEINAEFFDNARLLEEGMPPPPKFTSYLSKCANLPSDRSVYEQMRDDE